MKPRLKRWTGWISFLVLVLFVLGVALHTPPVKRIVASLASSFLSNATDTDVTIGQLDYQLWKGDIQAQDLTLTMEDAEIRLELTLPDTDFHISTAPSATIRRLRLNVTLLDDVEEGEVEPDDWFFVPYLPNIELKDGEIRIQFDDDRWLELDGVQGTGVWQESQVFVIEASVPKGNLNLADGSLAFGPIDAAGKLTEDRGLVVENLDVVADASRAGARGTLAEWSPVTLSLSIEYDLDARVIQRWLADSELEGRLAGDVRIDYADEEFHGEGSVRDGSLRWGESRPLEVQGQIELDRNVVSLQGIVVEADRGRVSLEAQMELADGGEQRFQASVAGLDVEGFARELLGDVPAIASWADGKGELVVQNWDFDDAAVGARIDFKPGTNAGALPVGGSLVLAGTISRLEVECRLASTALGAELELDGQWSSESLQARYRVHLVDIADTWAGLEHLDFTPAEIINPRMSGAVSLTGTLEGSPRAPTWNAEVSGNDLVVWDIPVHLFGTIEGDSNEARLSLFRIEGQSGVLSAEGSLPLDRESSWNIDLNLSKVSVDSLAADFGLPISGVLDGQGRISGLAEDPDWRVDARLDSEAFLGEFPGGARLSIEKSGPHISLTTLSASTEGASLEGSGTLQLDSEIVDGRVEWHGFSLTPLLGDLEGIEGRVRGKIEVGGSFESSNLTANLRIEDGAYRGKSIDPVVLEAVTEGRHVDLNLRLGDRLLARGSGTLESPYPFQFDVDLSALPFTPVVQGWTGVESEVDVAGRLVVEIPLLRPEELTYRAVVENYEAKFPNGSHRSSIFNVEGDRSSLHIQGLELMGGDRRFKVEGAIPLTGETSFDLKVAGEFALDLLSELSEDLTVTGQGQADLTVQGTWEKANLVGDVQLAEISGDWNGLSWNNVQLQASAEGERLRLMTASGNLLGGEFALQGEFPLALEQVDTPGRLEFALDHLDFGRLIDEDLGDLPRPGLIVSTHGVIDVAELALDGLRGSGEVSEVAFKVGDAEVKNPKSASWRLENGSFSVPELRLEGGSTDIAMSLGPIDFWETLQWRGSIRGALDNSLLNPYLRRSGMELSGTSRLDFEMSDGPGGFIIDGRGELMGGRFVLPDPPLVLSDLNGTVTIEKSMVLVSGVSARVGGGRLSGECSIDLNVPSKPKVDFRAEAAGIRLQFAEGVRGQVSGAVRFEGQESYLLSGNLILNQGFFNRELGQDDSLMSSSLQLPGDTSVKESFADRVALDISLQTEETVRVDTKQAQLETSGNLSLTGTLDSPELAGNLDVSPDGTFTVGRSRFQIANARLEFRDYPVSSPRLTLSAVTRVGSTLVRLDLEGEVDDLSTRLSAPDDPNLTEGDLASLLVTGRTLEKAGEGGQQIASTWAMSSMANLLNEGWGDMFTFGPPPGSGPLILEDEENPTSRLTLGRSITDGLSITYSVALDKTEDQLWILDYQVARNIWVRTMQRRGNEYSLGFSHRFDLDTKKSLSKANVEPEQQTISGIVVSGDYPGTEAEWLKQVRVKAGSQRDYWATQEDAQRIQKELIKRGFRSAVVDVETQTFEGQTTLVFLIQAGPPLEIAWEGDDPGGDLKKKTEAAWNGRVPESYLVSDLALRATWELRSQRYYSARVEGSVEETAEGRRVLFTTVKGARGTGISLDFQGNEVVDDAELARALPDTKTPGFFVLLDKPSEMEKGIRLLYASRGYLEVSIGTVETRYDAPSKTMHVVVPINEGPLWRLVTLRFDGADSMSPEGLRDAIGLREGQPFSLPEVKDAQVKIKSFYRESGFPDVAVKGELEEAPGGVEVTFRVEEGALAEVGTIRIVGTSRTRESVIRRQLTFDDGDAVRVSELQKSQRNLYDTRVFSSVDVRVDSGQEGKKHKDILVQVAERADLDVSYGLRYNLVTQKDTSSIDTQPEGLEGVLRASIFNPVGGGTTLGLSAFVQKKRTLLRATERFPHFFRFRLPTELIVEVERERRDFGFEFQGWSLAFQQTKAWRQHETGRDRFTVQWNVRAGRFTLACDPGSEGDEGDLPGCNLLPSAIYNEDEFRTTLGASLIEDRRDSLSNPSRGSFWSTTLQVSPKFLGSETQYVRLFGQFFYHYPLTKNLVWASSYRLGVASGSTEFLFIEDRFKAGGANSVRGFKQDSLGPSIAVPETDEEFFLGGQAVVVMNQELRFPLYKMLHGGVFYDTGNVFARAGDLSLRDLRHTAGAGVRLVLSFGVLRLDWARILDLQEGEDPSRFHFSFGYAF